jgi:hypothetical protein
VSVSSVSGSTTVSTIITDATATALQPLTGGPTIVLGSQAVDSTLGTYRFHLPVAAPVKAAYTSSTTPLAFIPDTLAAGKYTIQMQAAGRAPLQSPANISSGASTGVNFVYVP